MGALGGSIWHGVRGARNAPSGFRVPHAMDAVRARAPALGGLEDAQHPAAPLDGSLHLGFGVVITELARAASHTLRARLPEEPLPAPNSARGRVLCNARAKGVGGGPGKLSDYDTDAEM
mgnify:CR=1 FL=1